MTEFPRTAAISESVTLAVADRARALESRGRRVIKLQTGDPDFATHPIVIEAAHRAMEQGNTHYANTRGLPELRARLSEKFRVENGLKYDPATEILVTHGGAHAIFCALQALVSPGDEVVIPDPSWMPYSAATRMAGGIPVRVAMDPDRGFAMDVERIRSAITGRTRLIVINSPGNPSSRVWPDADLRKLSGMIDGGRAWILSDEVYEKLVYEGRQHFSPAAFPGLRERTVTVNSFSKSFAMTGWRLGYLAAPARLVSEVLKVGQYSITNVAPFVQLAGISALAEPIVAEDVRRMVTTYDARRRRITERLRKQDLVGFVEPEGAFYVMLDFRKITDNADEFAGALLEEESVALVPGSGFGACARGFARMTFAASDAALEEGLDRILAFAHRRVGVGRA